MEDIKHNLRESGAESCKPGEIPQTSSQAPTQAWYDDPIYSRYWEHYERMHQWFKHHDEVVSKLNSQHEGMVQPCCTPDFMCPSFHNSFRCHQGCCCCCCTRVCCCCKHACGCCNKPCNIQNTCSSRRPNTCRPRGQNTCSSVCQNTSSSRSQSTCSPRGRLKPNHFRSYNEPGHGNLQGTCTLKDNSRSTHVRYPNTSNCDNIQGISFPRVNPRPDDFAFPRAQMGGKLANNTDSECSSYSSSFVPKPSSDDHKTDAEIENLSTPMKGKKNKSGSKKSSKKKRKRRRRKSRSLCNSSCASIKVREVPTGDDDDDALDLLEGNYEMEMELTDEMADFFAQSAKHREERDLLKKKAAEEKKNSKDKDVYVEMAECSAGKNFANVLPPTERPGTRRIAEMRELYGSGAAMIQGMETAMQLSYDRNLDRRQPKLWPALPINIKFND